MLPAGYEKLIQEMLILTKQDLKIRSRKKGRFFQVRQDALTFIDTEWFEALCMAVQLDPEAVRHRLLVQAARQRLG